MNRTVLGLYDSEDLERMEAGTEGARMLACSIVAQSRDIALLCSAALDSVMDDSDDEMKACVEDVSSRLMYEIVEDLTIAMTYTNI